MPFLILIAWLALECWVVALVGDALGSLGLAIWAAIGTSFIGMSVIARSREKFSPEQLGSRFLAAGGDPGGAMVDAVGPLVGGALLVFPGFITDAAALLILFPPTRSLLSSLLKKLVLTAFRKQLEKRLAAQGLRKEDLEKAFGSMGGRSAPRSKRDEGTVRDADFTVID